MKNILVVGLQTTLGCGLAEAYSKDCNKLALISWNKSDGSSKKLKSIKKKLKDAGVDFTELTGDLNSNKEWRFVYFLTPTHRISCFTIILNFLCSRLMKEVTKFLDGKLDLFIYVDGTYSYSKLLDTTLDEARRVMQQNFVAPVLGITAALPLLKKSKGQLSIMASIAGF